MINLVFDYDGTIHESAVIYIPVVRDVYQSLVEKGLTKERILTDAEITSYLGMTAKEMWKQFMPSLTKQETAMASQRIGQQMCEAIEQGKARWYAHAEQVLEELQKEYRLLFLSNCKESYLSSNRKQFTMDCYFSDYFCSETYGWKPKYEIFNEIRKRYQGEFVIIGDRWIDIEIAKRHKLASIGCAYGYGSPEELADATWRVKDIREIPCIL